MARIIHLGVARWRNLYVFGYKSLRGVHLAVGNAQQVGLVGLERAVVGNGTEQVIFPVCVFSLDGFVVCATIFQLVCAESRRHIYLVWQQHGEAVLAVLDAREVAVGDER